MRYLACLLQNPLSLKEGVRLVQSGNDIGRDAGENINVHDQSRSSGLIVDREH
jgi:hypothetical protein